VRSRDTETRVKRPSFLFESPQIYLARVAPRCSSRGRDIAASSAVSSDDDDDGQRADEPRVTARNSGCDVMEIRKTREPACNRSLFQSFPREITRLEFPHHLSFNVCKINPIRAGCSTWSALQERQEGEVAVGQRDARFIKQAATHRHCVQSVFRKVCLGKPESR